MAVNQQDYTDFSALADADSIPLPPRSNTTSSAISTDYERRRTYTIDRPRDATKKRRVLHIVNGEHYSGSERVQDLLAANLPASNYHVEFVCLKPNRFPRNRKCVEAPIHLIPMRSRIDLRAVATLARLLRDDDFQLIHCHTPRTALVGRLASLRTGIPMVYHVHSPVSLDSTRQLQNRLNRMSERFSLRSAARLITVSQSLAGYMVRQGFDSTRIAVVPNGVPVSSERARPARTGRWTLSTVALFRPRKGTELLLEALSILRGQGYDVTLDAIGCFETIAYQKQLQTRAVQLGLEKHVRWKGFTSNVTEQMSRSHLFVLPSLFGEGMPMVVLEAMACGLPVIATDVEGVPEAIRDGLDGRIARAGNAGDLAQCIASVISGEFDWTQMSEMARNRHSREFSDAAMANGVARVYDDVLSSASR